MCALNKRQKEVVKVVLWQKSDLSYLSPFKTQTSSLYEKKNAVYYFQMSLFVPEIFKFFKYANWLRDDIKNSTAFWSNMMNRNISPDLNEKCLILGSTILLEVLHNMNLTFLLPWQHSGFQTSRYWRLFWPPLAFYIDITNGTWSASSSKHSNMLGQVHALV